MSSKITNIKYYHQLWLISIKKDFLEIKGYIQ